MLTVFAVPQPPEVVAATEAASLTPAEGDQNALGMVAEQKTDHIQQPTASVANYGSARLALTRQPRGLASIPSSKSLVGPELARTPAKQSLHGMRRPLSGIAGRAGAARPCAPKFFAAAACAAALLPIRRGAQFERQDGLVDLPKVRAENTAGQGIRG